jgi:hypothetical protein
MSYPFSVAVQWQELLGLPIFADLLILLLIVLFALITLVYYAELSTF